jgi:hypothetical protein
MINDIFVNIITPYIRPKQIYDMYKEKFINPIVLKEIITHNTLEPHNEKSLKYMILLMYELKQIWHHKKYKYDIININTLYKCFKFTELVYYIKYLKYKIQKEFHNIIGYIWWNEGRNKEYGTFKNYDMFYFENVMDQEFGDIKNKKLEYTDFNGSNGIENNKLYVKEMCSNMMLDDYVKICKRSAKIIIFSSLFDNRHNSDIKKFYIDSIEFHKGKKVMYNLIDFRLYNNLKIYHHVWYNYIINNLFDNMLLNYNDDLIHVDVILSTINLSDFLSKDTRFCIKLYPKLSLFIKRTLEYPKYDKEISCYYKYYGTPSNDMEYTEPYYEEHDDILEDYENVNEITIQLVPFYEFIFWTIDSI